MRAKVIRRIENGISIADCVVRDVGCLKDKSCRSSRCRTINGSLECGALAMTLFLLALALSMDAFAVAVGQGAAARHPTVREAIRIGLAFGSAQALMPLIGWALGLALASVIRRLITGLLSCCLL